MGKKTPISGLTGVGGIRIFRAVLEGVRW